MKISFAIAVIIAIVALFAVVSCGVNINLSAGPDADGKLALAQAGATATVQAAAAISTRTALKTQDQNKVDEGTQEFRTYQGNILAGALAGGLGLLLLVGIPAVGFIGALYFVFVVRRKARQPSATKSGPWTISTVPGLSVGGVVLHDDNLAQVTYVGADVSGKVFTPPDPSIAIAASNSRGAIGAGRTGGLQKIQDALAAMRAFQGTDQQRLLPPVEDSDSSG